MGEHCVAVGWGAWTTSVVEVGEGKALACKVRAMAAAVAAISWVGAALAVGVICGMAAGKLQVTVASQIINVPERISFLFIVSLLFCLFEDADRSMLNDPRKISNPPAYKIVNSIFIININDGNKTLIKYLLESLDSRCNIPYEHSGRFMLLELNQVLLYKMFCGHSIRNTP